MDDRMMTIESVQINKLSYLIKILADDTLINLLNLTRWITYVGSGWSDCLHNFEI